MRAQLDGVARHHGAHTVLEGVTLSVGAHSRLGVVGPNGVGKTTLLKLIAGLEQPDAGTVVLSPDELAVGYVPQDRRDETDETLLASLARRTGIASAERALHDAAQALAEGRPGAGDRYDVVLRRFLTLGGGDFEARARTVTADLGLRIPLDQRSSTLSGGEAARASLAAILLSRYDVLCLDEPTNDLDFDGLERLERFVDGFAGALVVVSHDRAFLDRCVERIVEIDPWRHGVREFAGGWTEYQARRDEERHAAYAAYEQAHERRRELTELLGRRRTEARSLGAGLGEATGGADRRATHALTTKVRQAERMLERNPAPERPYEPWQLRLAFTGGPRPGHVVATLEGAVARRGSFELGPVDLDLRPGERLAVTGRNGSGKSTLLGMLLGDVPLVSGARRVGRGTRIGAIGQTRASYAGVAPLLEELTSRSGLATVQARTLLAKFGLGADHVNRPCVTLSPGERTRAHLAELQSRGVNLLVLDEPTNHLDLEAVEQLESALAGYEGTLVVVSHDRRFLEAIAPTREIGL